VFLFRARGIVSSFLRAHPGATKDRVYDNLLSKLLQDGKVPEHDFENILRGVAEQRGEPEHVVGTGVRRGAYPGRWYLRQ